MEKDIEIFINKYADEVREHNAAVFLGAGFSKTSGFVDWKELLKDIAGELELDVEKESDLVSLAQYYCNENQSRSQINKVIFESFSQDAQISENHRILARLPIFTYWTTNYDSLIEDALKEIQKRVDVKCNNEQLSLTLPQRDAVLYKMHGDKNFPNQAIIIKDDYERYYNEHAPFITALSGDLISKTFLFAGFSFTDPNINYILSRVRINYGGSSPRPHYAIMRRIHEDDYSSKADFEYEQRKHQLFINDLKRYNIKVLLVNEYSEVTEILHGIERKVNYKNVFISGSACCYADWEPTNAPQFISALSQRLIKEGYNIISGFGLGVGSHVITGALEEIYMHSKSINDNRLLLRPFPQGIENPETRKRLWTAYRKDMISRAGISIFIFGNKRNTAAGSIVRADGMYDEFKIAEEAGCAIIPVGSTGYVAKEIWEVVSSNIDKYYPDKDDKFKQKLGSLATDKNSDTLIDSIIDLIKSMQ